MVEKVRDDFFDGLIAGCVMRLLVGTLYTIENEIDRCVASIEMQRGVSFEHFILKDLPNKEAHDTLYRRFMDNADAFDLFVKVDADMVLTRDTLFLEMTKKFEAIPCLEDLNIAVHDFYTDQLIFGLHAYRNTVRWPESDENLFVDACPLVHPDARLDDMEDLAPAAWHCPSPSPFQAFHYGVQKAVKLVQPDRENKLTGYLHFYWGVINRLHTVFYRTQDIRIGFAALGAEIGLRGGISPARLSYNDPALKQFFTQRFAHLPLPAVRRLCQRYRLTRLGFLPDRYSRAALNLLPLRPVTV